MKKRFIILFFIIPLALFSQEIPKQTVRGKVYDSETKYPLIGVKVVLVSSSDTINKYQGISDIDGNFNIKNVPVGKYNLEARYMTYDTKVMTVEVISGKELIVDVPMQESFLEQEEVTVTARKKGEVINELALISARQFSVSETDRYPGSRSDPARMVSNFAGIGGSDDSRNDIVIRGNSPLGVIWRVEGIDIPNPSHFAISGSTGGPVSILNNKILANSDFFMSAFPAEYGNSTSGVFDLKLRNGNNQTHEFTGQFGFLGTEALAEGPMSKTGKSSYLVMGRYSTMSIFQALGISIGTDAVPLYGDGAFKLNWQLKNRGNISVWGIGGASKISIIMSDKTKYTEELFGATDRDQYFGTSMATSGLTYKQPLNEKTFLTTTTAFNHERQTAKHDYLIRSIDLDSNIITHAKYQLMGFSFNINRLSNYTAVNHKLNKRHLIKTGVLLDYYMYNMKDSILKDGHNAMNHDDFRYRWDYKGNAAMLRAFAQWKWRITENMDFTAGLHNQYFSLSNSLSVFEPRLGWKWRMRNNQALSAGAGLHSQTQPQYIYFYHQTDTITGERELHNIDMDFMKSVHTVAGYEKQIGEGIKIKTEAYYQYLYNVPVTVRPSAFSVINMGSGFSRFFPEELQNTGTGYNYGIELTVQKYFDRSFFFLLTGTLYDSKYRGSDGVLRNTSYNGTYIANVLAGKEFRLNEKQTISLGLKITTAGGKRYGYVDIEASKKEQDIVFKDSLFNERQFRDYFRMDLKVNWKFNAWKVTHEIGLDLVNILNTKNILSLVYSPNLVDPTADPIAVRYQLGFLPIFYYKIDFKLSKRRE